MTLLPFIRREVQLKTTRKELIRTLRRLTEDGFNFARVEEEPEMLYTSDWIKEYEAEIDINSFWIRKMDRGTRTRIFKNTIHGKLTQRGEILTFKYTILPNLLTSIVYFTSVLFTFKLFYTDILMAKANNSYTWFLVLVPHVLFLAIFNIHAGDDKIFIDKLVSRTSQK